MAFWLPYNKIWDISVQSAADWCSQKELINTSQRSKMSSSFFIPEDHASQVGEKPWARSRVSAEDKSEGYELEGGREQGGEPSSLVSSIEEPEIFDWHL